MNGHTRWEVVIHLGQRIGDIIGFSWGEFDYGCLKFEEKTFAIKEERRSSGGMAADGGEGLHHIC